MATPTITKINILKEYSKYDGYNVLVYVEQFWDKILLRRRPLEESIFWKSILYNNKFDVKIEKMTLKSALKREANSLLFQIKKLLSISTNFRTQALYHKW